jgi:hypothetical protein
MKTEGCGVVAWGCLGMLVVVAFAVFVLGGGHLEELLK